jgi:predicted MFS family arabinose efflux permease
VTVAYATLPALVVQAVHEDETGVANAVNSIARSVGQALGSTLAVTLIAASLDPVTGFPTDGAFTQVALIGALATLAVMVVAAVGLLADRRGGTGHRPDPLTDVEEATARAGEWSPVSGIR